MSLLKSFLLLLFLISYFGSFAQSREQISVVNVSRELCTTCITEISRRGVVTQTNCQPNPLAGTEGHTSLGYNIEDIWGAKQIQNINGRDFNIFNANAAQIQKIRIALEVLPSEYINVLPLNFRIGNPNHGYSHVCSPAHDGIGGSKFCNPHNLESLNYESIVIGCQALQARNNAPYMTILHECGHFISRFFDMPSKFIGEESSLSSEYLRNDYSGRTSSHEETCAQALYQFFLRRNFGTNGTLLATQLLPDEIYNARTSARHRRSYPRWMDTFIQRVISETSSEL
jgi:hypothetical protein